MHVFLQDQIINIEYMQADIVLRLFVEQIPSLYNLQFTKYNTHLLLHIPKSVKDYGALWA